MAWFKKEKEGGDIPDLPELPEVEEFLSEKDENSEEDMYSSDEAIPDPVMDELEKHENSEEDRYSQDPMQAAISQPSPRGLPKPTHTPSSHALKRIPETQFVRIDKFEASYDAILAIKQKMDEMKSILKSLRKTNAEEDSELSEWEHEISEIRSKLEEIDKSLFQNSE